jgi:hypothetical protein
MSAPHTTHLDAAGKGRYPTDEWTQCYALTLELAKSIASWTLVKDDAVLVDKLAAWIKTCVPDRSAFSTTEVSKDDVGAQLSGEELSFGVTVNRRGFATISYSCGAMRGSIPFGSQIAQELQATMPVESLLETLRVIKPYMK